MNSYKIVIKKDASGKTYEYQMFKNDVEFLSGDGNDSIEEIKRFLKDIADAVNFDNFIIQD